MARCRDLQPVSPEEQNQAHQRDLLSHQFLQADLRYVQDGFQNPLVIQRRG